MNAKLIGIIVLLAFLIILAIQNYQPVSIEFLFWTYKTSMVLTVVVSFLVGCLVGGLALWIGAAKKKKKKEVPPPPQKD
jgi:uncharacterized integral membrane protein